MQDQMTSLLSLLKSIFGSDLLGVYLYGSAVFGGLQPHSDIDIFVLTGRPMTNEEKAALTSSLLQLSGHYMKTEKRPIELTIAQQSNLNPWHYPAEYDYQYGEWLRSSLETDSSSVVQGGPMPDLAVLITQILLKHETLWGPPAHELLSPVPPSDFIKAMIYDLPRFTAYLENDTRNILLTFARILSVLRTQTLRTKPAAADWVLAYLPIEFHPVLKRAKSICLGNEKESWDNLKDLIRPCAEWMASEIQTLASKTTLTSIQLDL